MPLCDGSNVFLFFTLDRILSNSFTLDLNQKMILNTSNLSLLLCWLYCACTQFEIVWLRVRVVAILSLKVCYLFYSFGTGKICVSYHHLVISHGVSIIVFCFILLSTLRFEREI
jgi:hypothetical protein